MCLSQAALADEKIFGHAQYTSAPEQIYIDLLTVAMLHR